MKLNIRVFNNCQSPLVRKHDNDAGADIMMNNTHFLHGIETYKIPLGFGVDIPAGYCGYIKPRSSMPLQFPCLIVHECPIDTGYTGEIHAIVSKVGDGEYILRRGERYFQLVIEPVVTPDFEIDYEENRGNGGFGSTGK